MSKSVLAYATFGLSAVACVLAVVALVTGGAAPTPAVTAVGPDNAHSQELVAQIAQVRADLDHLAGAVRAGPALESTPERTAVQPAVPLDVQDRLTALENSVTSLQQQVKERVVAAKPKAAEAMGLADAQRIATDLRASEQDRLAALKALRGQKVNGVDALSSDVVLAMIDVAERSQDENTRNDVYRDLHGVNNTSLRDSMLRALASDPSPKVRERVARDIDTYLADALVQGALRQAADYDADLGVRGQALKTLSGQH